MADFVPTSISPAATDGITPAHINVGIAAEAIAFGAPIRIANANQIYEADSSTLANAAVTGISLGAFSIGEIVSYINLASAAGKRITVNTGLTAGQVYFVPGTGGSAWQPQTDLLSEYVSQLGIATAATELLIFSKAYGFTL